MKTDATQQPLADLPFVVGAQLWVTAPSGAWADDNATGRDYADALLTHISTAGLSPLLGQVTQEIMARGRWSGIEVGFFNRIAERAAG